MKRYDLVIQDSLEDLITVTNIAVELGYRPVGGIRQIEDKFIQAIYHKNMSNFIKAISLLLADRQEFKLTAKKIKEDLVLTITPDAKGTGKVTHVTIPAEDLNDEIDSKVLGALNTTEAPKKAEFQASTTEGSAEEEEDEDDKKPKGGNISPSKKSGKTSKQSATAKTNKTAASKKSSVKVPNKSAPAKKGLSELTGNKKKGLGALLENKTNSEAETDQNIPESPETVPNDQETVTGDQKIETTPDEPALDFEGLMAQGKALFEKRKYPEAEAMYAKAVELVPTSAAAATELNRAKKWAKAQHDMKLKETSTT